MERYRYSEVPEIIQAPEGHRSTLVWTLGSDPITRALSDQIGYFPSDTELDFALSATQRDQETLTKLTRIDGRRANFEGEPLELFGATYDSLEIGGYGHRPLILVRTGLSYTDPSTPVLMPSADNFATLQPEVVKTEVVVGKELVTMEDDFSFAGAYTKDQATRKVAANLFFLDAAQTQQDLVVPIPIAIGQYPDIRNPQGEPAHYIVWRAPHDGRRHGDYIKDGAASENAYIQHVDAALQRVPYVARVIRDIHDRYGLTHNQPTITNFYVPLDDGPVYLADFSTVHPLSDQAPVLARGMDLGRIIVGATRTSAVLQHVDKTQLLRRLYRTCIQAYTGRPAARPAPNSLKELPRLVDDEIRIGINSRRIPANTPNGESWSAIQDIKTHLDTIIAA